MKNSLSILLTTILLISVSCRQHIPTLINGDLININDTSIIIEIRSDPITGIEPSQYPKAHVLSDSGTFSIPIETSLPVQAVLYSENYTFIASVVILQAGEITLKANCSDMPSSLRYIGNGASLNSFLLNLEEFRASTDKEIARNVESLESFEKTLDSVQSISIALLEGHNKEEPLSSDEFLWLSSKIKYSKYYKLLSYSFDQGLDITESGPKIFHTLDLADNKASIISATYNEIVLRFILTEVNSRGLYFSDYSDNIKYFESFYEIINLKLSDKVRDAALTMLISDMLKNYRTIAADYYDSYLVDCKSPEMIEKTTELYQKYLEITQQPLDDKVNIISTNQKPSLEVLNEYSDKVVLLDFWASWCSPCIKGIPLTKKISKDYDYQGLEVIFVGNNDQKSNLLNAIKEHQIDGNHIILTEEESKTWRNDFKIRGIPTYILLDKEGNVVNMANPHKITNETYSLIDSLLL